MGILPCKREETAMSTENWRRGFRGIVISLAATLIVAAPAMARVHHHYFHGAHYYGPSAGRHYRNVNGDSVHSPMRAANRPAGATAHCADGSWSFSQHHSGTCSHHGGVNEWVN
jgi:hypothetical protein